MKYRTTLIDLTTDLLSVLTIQFMTDLITVSGFYSYPRPAPSENMGERTNQKVHFSLVFAFFANRLTFYPNVATLRSVFAITNPSLTFVRTVLRGLKFSAIFLRRFVGYLSHPLTSGQSFTEIVPGEAFLRER